MLLRLEEVSKSYGAQEVLRGVTVQINPGECVGLVGRNGAGKTTIFRLISGTEEPDGGRVTLLRGLRVGLLGQQPVFDGSIAVREEALSVFAELHAIEQELARLEHLMADVSGADLDEAMHAYSDLRHRYESSGGFSYHALADSVLAGLGFTSDDRAKPSDQLSGGQKARLALAKLLLAEPDVMLLDEPTNHLDVNAVEWLEDFLGQYKKAFVIISHDRFLLDHTTTRIVEIEAGRTTTYQGNYSAYVRQREERRATQMRQYEQQQAMISRTEDFIRRNIAGQKTKQAKSRRNMLERLERVERVENPHGANFNLGGVARAGDNVLAVSEMAVGYADSPLARGMSFLIHRGERLGVIGPNGSGKTTFLRTINGEIEPLEGGFTWGANIAIEYFDQELKSLDYRSTVIDEMAGSAPRVGTGELRGYLARFLFTGDDILKSVSALSGGEANRLALAKMIYSGANVLILDEPTNHLDIPSREALEQALSEYQGTIIAVSHDRYFLDRIATEILHFENGQATYHQGGYTDFYNQRHLSAQAKRDTSKPVAPVEYPKPRTKKQSKRRIRGSEEIEDEIHALEEEMRELVASLSHPPADWKPEKYAEISARQQAIHSRLESLYLEWESGTPSDPGMR